MRSRYAGEIYLSFTRRGEQTVADRTFRRGNSRISANNAPGNETPYYFLISTGGGFTEGEQYLQDISLGESTHAILTTQAPGYIYKCENGRLTEQKFQIRIGDGACLEYYQDETIPYALARFRQRTEIELGRGSRLLLTDGLTAGWSADEQPFQYHDIGICTRVRRNGRLLLNDSLLVNPSADPMGEIGYFEGFTNYNSAVFFDESIEPETVDQMRESLADLSTESMWGLTYLDGGGALLRVIRGVDPLLQRRALRVRAVPAEEKCVICKNTAPRRKSPGTVRRACSPVGSRTFSAGRTSGEAALFAHNEERGAFRVAGCGTVTALIYAHTAHAFLCAFRTESQIQGQ